MSRERQSREASPRLAPTDANASPIADVSYRTYDGPLHSRTARWWPIARTLMRSVWTKPIYWVFAVVSTWPYLRCLFFLYLQSNDLVRQRPGQPDIATLLGLFDTTTGQRYAFQFYGALTTQWFIWMVPVCLVVGAGALAADNRANALLVYLSKPITKADYLLGKWMGVFLMLFLTALVPCLFLYGYCLLSYVSSGFLRDEPWLIGRIAIAAGVPAALHASLLVGFSAWSKTPRMAGALYAGFVFATWSIALMAWGIVYRGDYSEGTLLRHLSLTGVSDGLLQNVCGLTLHSLSQSRHRGFESISNHPPQLSILLAIAATLAVAGIAAARARIHAVEVVRG